MLFNGLLLMATDEIHPSSLPLTFGQVRQAATAPYELRNIEIYDAAEVIERYWDLIDAMRRRFGFSAGFMSSVITGHRRLLEAIAGRDVEAAVEIAETSCERSKHDLIEQMRAHRQETPPPKTKHPNRQR
jgi:hypothetical protein